MDLGVFDAWAGLLISHPHHQLSAAPSVSQITEFVVVVWPEDKKGNEGGEKGGTFPSGPFCLQAAHTLVLIRKRGGGRGGGFQVCSTSLWVNMCYDLHLEVYVGARVSCLSVFV